MIFSKKSVSQSFNQNITSEKPIRSVIKALSWRFIGTIDTLIVSYIITGKVSLAASIASIDFVSKLILYFFHERIWNQVKWGK